MKKSLLALAVLGAFAGAASAQTNVTIYGLVDAAITRVDSSGPNNATWTLDSSGQFNKNGSRLGFKGTEDLGGGLSAIFTLENGFGVDNGTLQQGGRLFGRQAFVGVQGGFGALKFGRQYTPMHLALDSIDPFGTGMAGNIENPGLFNPAGLRSDNTVNFSMNAAGLTGQVAYSFGEQAGAFPEGRQIGAGLGYANGPVNVQLAYHNTKANPLATPAALNDAKVALLGGSFDLGVAKLHAGFQTERTELGATGAVNAKKRNWMLGASAPVGAGEIRASFIRADDRLNANNRDDRDQYALGYVHNLSKRSNVYTSFARINDKSDVTNVDTNVFNVGLQHKF